MDIDPEEAKARLQLATYHIEASARKFDIRPHLVQLYNEVKAKYNFPGMEAARQGDEFKNKLIKWKSHRNEDSKNLEKASKSPATRNMAELDASNASPNAQTRTQVGELEGREKYEIKDSTGIVKAEIDMIEGKTLWEEKSAIKSISPIAAKDTTSKWVRKFITNKVQRVYEARKLLPKFYHDAGIGFDFTSVNVNPAFQKAVNTEINRLRSVYHGVHIVVRWR